MKMNKVGCRGGRGYRVSSSIWIVVAAAVVILQSLGDTTDAQSSSISDTHVALFVFGDSLYDVGMNAYFKKGTLATDVPYGETYFKTPTGRYSDGRLILDYITQYAKLPLLQPYLKPGFTYYINGVSFAAAGACVLSDIRPGTINLKMQVNYFLEMVGKLKKQIGEAQSSKLLKQAVYLFSIGGNDYANLISTIINTQSILTPAYKTHYINMVLANLTTHIQTIYNSGGRKVAFHQQSRYTQMWGRTRAGVPSCRGHLRRRTTHSSWALRASSSRSSPASSTPSSTPTLRPTTESSSTPITALRTARRPAAAPESTTAPSPADPPPSSSTSAPTPPTISSSTPPIPPTRPTASSLSSSGPDPPPSSLLTLCRLSSTCTSYRLPSFPPGPYLSLPTLK